MRVAGIDGTQTTCRHAGSREYRCRQVGPRGDNKAIQPRGAERGGAKLAPRHELLTKLGGNTTRSGGARADCARYLDTLISANPPLARLLRKHGSPPIVPPLSTSLAYYLPCRPGLRLSLQMSDILYCKSLLLAGRDQDAAG
ncbi:hypothetical protein Bbelb_263890 [Branchiostoma belcheri]|nr:hypothetical protein Bbelb_263890 [Branchiostoma belcheri]